MTTDKRTASTQPGYAVRLNAFKPVLAGSPAPSLPDLIAAAGRIEGITSAEPRAHALLPDAATTLLAIKDADRANLGVTLDMAHALMADEIPAYSAHLFCRNSRLLGVHLNDARGMMD